MGSNLDNVLDRRGTSCLKWDSLKPFYGRDDVLPMWVADMDFKAPPAVIEALSQRVQHGVFGYTAQPDSYDDAVISWFDRRFNWRIQKEWLSFSPGVVTGLTISIRAFTHPGDKVIIQTPVYYPFYQVIKDNGCQVVENPLKLEHNRYLMDFEDLKKKAKDPEVKLLILCSPHNPVGRVWTKAELQELGDICINNDVMVVSDEIHCDVIYRDAKHIPFASISEKFAANSITTIATSKTFNLAGLKNSIIIIPNKKILSEFDNMSAKHRVGMNVFGMLATEMAYTEGEEYLEQLIDYLSDNLNYLTDFIKQNIPGIKVIKPEGTYLVWLDCRELGMDRHQLDSFFINEAKVALNSGYGFGLAGAGFMRINIACPKPILQEGLTRIKNAVDSLV
ncbi:pyridoxal phosphate-dependent aminotransferase [Metallumcola ferriviriculae]|uniref:cysteine-S-conjugate beta-lyase n=1 Tax=Metallumcola ferriviriculae TaxID=3039180 RepID=A0AAU0UKR0_9FIRM|nr:pyridoxal phosphate-dependent aminotransferase [Desulfitibacteraceae bacterium MK1]